MIVGRRKGGGGFLVSKLVGGPRGNGNRKVEDRREKNRIVRVG